MRLYQDMGEVKTGEVLVPGIVKMCGNHRAGKCEGCGGPTRYAIIREGLYSCGEECTENILMIKNERKEA